MTTQYAYEKDFQSLMASSSKNGNGVKSGEPTQTYPSFGDFSLPMDLMPQDYMMSQGNLNSSSSTIQGNAMDLDAAPMTQSYPFSALGYAPSSFGLDSGSTYSIVEDGSPYGSQNSQRSPDVYTHPQCGVKPTAAHESKSVRHGKRHKL